MQTSPKRLVEFSPEDYPHLTFKIRPATGPERTEYLGELGKDDCNQGKLANDVCRRHVFGADGVPREFNKTDATRFDDWEPEWIMAIMGFVVSGSKLLESEAKNSE